MVGPGGAVPDTNHALLRVVGSILVLEGLLMRRAVLALLVLGALALGGCSDKGKPCKVAGQQEWHHDGDHMEHLTCTARRGGLEWR